VKIVLVWDAKAPEGWRSPRRFAKNGTATNRPASWSAAALRRFMMRLIARSLTANDLEYLFAED
jgi:hypothetical protein